GGAVVAGESPAYGRRELAISAVSIANGAGPSRRLLPCRATHVAHVGQGHRTVVWPGIAGNFFGDRLLGYWRPLVLRRGRRILSGADPVAAAHSTRYTGVQELRCLPRYAALMNLRQPAGPLLAHHRPHCLNPFRMVVQTWAQVKLVPAGAAKQVRRFV